MDIQKLYYLSEKFYGVKKGFDYLNALLDDLKKKKILKSKGIEIYDYRDKVYFSVDMQDQELNNYIQMFYINFFVKTQITASETFIFCYNALLKKLAIEDKNNVYYEIVTIIFMWLKRLICAKPINGFLISNFFDKVVGLLDQNISKNSEINMQLLNLFFQILIEENIIIIDGDYFYLYNLEYFFELQFFRFEMVDIYSDDLNIKYSCNYALNQLALVIDNYQKNTDKKWYNVLSLIVIVKDHNKLKLFEQFAENFSDLRFFPKDFNFLLQDKKAMECFEGIFYKKWILNEYCFQTIAVSCFKNYYYNIDKFNNILLQKTDPALNLNL